MNLQSSFSDEDLTLLRDTVRSLLAHHWSARSRAAPAEALASSWQQAVETGLAGLGASKETGGWRAVLVVAEELGRAACPAPLIDAALGQMLATMAAPGGDARAAEPSREAAGLSREAAALSREVAAGRCIPAFAFGFAGGDAGAGRIRCTADGRIDGRVDFAEVSPLATHLVVPVTGTHSEECFAIIARSDPGLALLEHPGLAAAPLASITLSGARGDVLPVRAGTIETLVEIARLALVARALGAARRAFELAVEHAKTRRQFGQPIGRFQAIQHKLANGLICLEATMLLLADAGRRFDGADSRWRDSAAATMAFAAPSLRQLALEIHHTLGAIGFAEEHEAPAHFRRICGDLARLGGARRARAHLADMLLRDGPASLPDFDLGERAESFRAEVRQWLARHWNAGARAHERHRPFHEREVDREFSRRLGEQGWIGVSWPAEHGGRGVGPLEQFVFMEEMALAGAPLGAHNVASEMIGPALIAFGTDEQKARFLPAIRRGEIFFSLGYSESEAGSDLASLRLKAVRDGDHWVLDGEKLWTSRGDVAQYHWLAARTNPSATPPHAGISMFMVPLDTPGISIRTSMALHGHTFSSVRYEGVRVADSARVGPVGGGWKVITHALANERIVMGSYVATIRSLFDALTRHVATACVDGGALRDDAVLRDRLGGLVAEIEAARHLAVNGVRIVARGGVPLHEAAMSKVYSGELLQRVTQAAIDLLGPVATLGEDSPLAILDGRIEQQLRRSIMMVVGGGTAEVQRNVIAQRGLGLPR